MPHQALTAFAAWSGPHNARVVLVGEAWGGSEQEIRQPFAGESGKLLWQMLGEAWPSIDPDEHSRVEGLQHYGLAWVRQRASWLETASCAMTNVLNFRPAGNSLDTICAGKAEMPPGYPLPALIRGKYLQPEYLPELDRLATELAICNPNLVVAMGNTAAWAVLQSTSIGAIRGTVTEGRVSAGVEDSDGLTYKVLPTYHPAAVLRMWPWRVIVIADLMKALREQQFPEIRRPQRTVLVSPTLAELQTWASSTLGKPPSLLSCDIETGGGQIKCIGFASSLREAMVVPFVDQSVPGWSYWSASEEPLAWECVRQLLESDIPKIFQNGMYDLQYLLRVGLRPQRCTEDLMLLHHSLYPELQKGLGFLGSIYTNEAAWKLMRRAKPDSVKRDE